MGGSPHTEDPSTPFQKYTPSLCPLFFHPQTPERLRHVVIIGVGRLPRYAFAVGRRALKAIKVDAQILTGLRLSFVNLAHRNAHLAVPDFIFLVDAGFDFKAGIPLPVVVGRIGVAINVQINPFAVWRDLEFGVAFNVLKIRADEDFSNIPLPEQVGFRRG